MAIYENYNEVIQHRNSGYGHFNFRTNWNVSGDNIDLRFTFTLLSFELTRSLTIILMKICIVWILSNIPEQKKLKAKSNVNKTGKFCRKIFAIQLVYFRIKRIQNRNKNCTFLNHPIWWSFPNCSENKVHYQTVRAENYGHDSTLQCIVLGSFSLKTEIKNPGSTYWYCTLCCLYTYSFIICFEYFEELHLHYFSTFLWSYKTQITLSSLINRCKIVCQYINFWAMSHSKWQQK